MRLFQRLIQIDTEETIVNSERNVIAILLPLCFLLPFHHTLLPVFLCHISWRACHDLFVLWDGTGQRGLHYTFVNDF